MCELRFIAPAERPGVDPCRIEELFFEFGSAKAEELVYRVIEDLSQSLCQVHDAAFDGRAEDMHKALGRVADRSDYIGLCSLARVAQDVRNCIEDADHVAEAATLARLARCGERSLALLWDLQDVSS